MWVGHVRQKMTAAHVTALTSQTAGQFRLQQHQQFFQSCAKQSFGRLCCHLGACVKIDLAQQHHGHASGLNLGPC